MGWTQRLINGVRNARRLERPAAGRLLQSRRADSLRDYPGTGLTPGRLTAILREADAGSPGRALQLFEEMEEKDAHLQAVANKRRLALTGLEWEVRSAAEVLPGVERKPADEAAAWCRETLAGIEGFDAALQHLALAVGRNIALAELVWEPVGGELVLSDVVPVDFGRIVFDELDRPRVLTDEHDYQGLELPPNKFVVHAPHSVSGHPFRGGLLRATALVYLAKNLALKDWMIFAEVFGMPVRVARYEPGASLEEKQEMLRMLESLGSNAAGVFSRAVELQFIEAGQGKAPPPYENLVDFLNREMSKAWLGQTLTTESAGVSGSLAATRVHDEVRKDLRTDDIRREGRTIRRDLLAPLTRLKFGSEVPVPFFGRRLPRPRSVAELTDVLEAAVGRLGLQVSRRWVHEALGLPEPAAGEAVLGSANSSADQGIRATR